MAAPTLGEVKGALWEHQVGAVDLVRRYMKAWDGRGSALVRFPTGTGKTGVIATAALLLAPDGLVIILSPSKALCEQLWSPSKGALLLVLYYDSLGLLSEAVRRRVVAAPAAAMHGLYGLDARTTSLSMKNTDIGQHSIRSRSVQAHSLAQVATGLTDHGYLCSTAQGYVAPPAKGQPGIRRYMGVASGRLTESGPKDLGLAGFLDWAAGNVKILDQQSHDQNIVFRRFARHVVPPDDTTPRHILLDIGEYISRGAYRSASGDELLDVEDLAVDVQNGRFSITANGVEFEVLIRYNEKKQRYHLEAKELDAAFVKTESSDRFRRGLVAQMNIDQAFRVVPSAGWTIYAHGLFVEPTSGVGSNAASGLDLLGIFTEVSALGATTSEKGGPGTASNAGWSERSVFGLLDRCAAGAKTPPTARGLADKMSAFDLLVCDDMGQVELPGKSGHRRYAARAASGWC